MAVNALDLLNDTTYSCATISIDDAMPALEAVHKHDRPYDSEQFVGGDLYLFDDAFITKISDAMSNDSLAGFTADELELWNRLVVLDSKPAGYVPTDAERPELALDNILMDLVNCVDTLTRPNTETPVDVFPCPIV